MPSYADSDFFMTIVSSFRAFFVWSGITFLCVCLIRHPGHSCLETLVTLQVSHLLPNRAEHQAQGNHSVSAQQPSGTSSRFHSLSSHSPRAEAGGIVMKQRLESGPLVHGC